MLSKKFEKTKSFFIIFFEKNKWFFWILLILGLLTTVLLIYTLTCNSEEFWYGMRNFEIVVTIIIGVGLFGFGIAEYWKTVGHKIFVTCSFAPHPSFPFSGIPYINNMSLYNAKNKPEWIKKIFIKTQNGKFLKIKDFSFEGNLFLKPFGNIDDIKSDRVTAYCDTEHDSGRHVFYNMPARDEKYKLYREVIAEDQKRLNPMYYNMEIYIETHESFIKSRYIDEMLSFNKIKFLKAYKHISKGGYALDSSIVQSFYFLMEDDDEIEVFLNLQGDFFAVHTKHPEREYRELAPWLEKKFENSDKNISYRQDILEDIKLARLQRKRIDDIVIKKIYFLIYEIKCINKIKIKDRDAGTFHSLDPYVINSLEEYLSSQTFEIHKKNWFSKKYVRLYVRIKTLISRKRREKASEMNKIFKKFEDRMKKKKKRSNALR